ncbi:MAG: tetratricopeptide repeat protein [Planctomycetota bacterium]
MEKSKEWGLESFKARDYIKATKKCLFAVEASPQNRELKYYFALTLFATQRFDLAAKQLEEYLLLNPKQFPEWRPLYTTLEDYQQHYQLLCLSRENQPMNPSLNLLYSILLIQEGKIKEARLQLYKLLETSPNSVAIQTALKLLN